MTLGKSITYSVLSDTFSSKTSTPGRGSLLFLCSNRQQLGDRPFEAANGTLLVCKDSETDTGGYASAT